MKNMKVFTILVMVGLLVVFAASLSGCKQATPTPAPPANSLGSIGRDLVYLGGDRVLEYLRETYRIWIYDRNVKGSADPLKGPEVWGSWSSVNGDDRWIYLGNDRVLDWDSYKGDYRIYVYDRSRRGNVDPFPGDPEVYGNWSSISIGFGDDYHDISLIYLDQDRLLEWHDNDGKYWVWVYDRSKRGETDPISYCETSGRWTSITDDGNHQLYYLGGHVLDLDQNGNYRAYWFERSARGEADPLPGLTNWGTWSSIRTYQTTVYQDEQDRIIYLDNNRVLVWDTHDGDYRIYVADWGRLNTQDPLPGGPEVWGNWSSIN